MNNTGYFRGGAVFKDDRVYALSRSVTTHQDSREDEISYSISEYVVTAVGRLYLTANNLVKPRPLTYTPRRGFGWRKSAQSPRGRFTCSAIWNRRNATSRFRRSPTPDGKRRRGDENAERGGNCAGYALESPVYADAWLL